jgi:hypothetical protein
MNNTKKTLYQKIFHFFDRLEDHVRGHLSKYPIFYAFIAGIIIVLFWRAVWHTGDLLESKGGVLGFLFSGPVSFITSLFFLLLTGVFVSTFVGDMIIMSGLKREKKIVDKTEQELEEEKDSIGQLELGMSKAQEEIELIENNQERLERKIDEQSKMLKKLLDK